MKDQGGHAVTSDELAQIVANHESDIRMHSQQMQNLENSQREGFKNLATHLDRAIAAINEKIERRDASRPSSVQMLAGGASVMAILGGIFIFTFFLIEMQVYAAKLEIEKATNARVVKIECAMGLDSDCRGYSNYAKSSTK